MKIGERIYYDYDTGEVLLRLGKMEGNICPRKNHSKIEYIDLSFDDETLTKAKRFHIKNKKIVIDERR